MFNNTREGLLPKYLKENKNMINFVKFINAKKPEEQKKLGLLCYKIQKEYKQMI